MWLWRKFYYITLMSLSANYFDIFVLPVSFDIEQNLLGERYRDLQRTVHPDKYANASEKERLLAMQKATQINEAYQILKNPQTRARYLLKLQGIETNDNATITDSEFLMRQMELREELAELKQIDPLNAFLSRLEKQIEDLTDTLSQQFSQKNYQQAYDTVRQFQFFIRLHEEVLSLEEELI